MATRNCSVNGNQYKMGDCMTVAEADIEDWMIRNGADVYGGYTVRQAFADMPRSRRRNTGSRSRIEGPFPSPSVGEGGREAAG
ncbi:DUF2314 domain-containing protein [Mesorhizobium sp. USDA-HM6]|nr:DUF2314 domain-containing protein [Mesorhizobium sp. USDA-HM6]